MASLFTLRANLGCEKTVCVSVCVLLNWLFVEQVRYVLTSG